MVKRARVLEARRRARDLQRWRVEKERREGLNRERKRVGLRLRLRLKLEKKRSEKRVVADNRDIKQ